MAVVVETVLLPVAALVAQILQAEQKAWLPQVAEAARMEHVQQVERAGEVEKVEQVAFAADFQSSPKLLALMTVMGPKDSAVMDHFALLEFEWAVKQVVMEQTSAWVPSP
jgi:hypothetical protein